MAAAQSSPYLTAIFLSSAPFVFINFGLPIQADEMGVDAVGIGAMYTVFTGTLLLVRPLVGYLLDRLGRRWFFTISFAFYAGSMGVFSLSTDIADFFVARGLQGIGASLMWVAARTMVADLTPPDGRGEAMGRMSATSVRGSMLGAVYGFTLVGFMPDTRAWTVAFAGYAVLALLALAWSLLKVRETRDPTLAPPRRERLRLEPALVKALVIVFLTAFGSALIEPIYLIYLKNKFDVGMQVLAFAFLPAGIVFAILPAYAGRWSDRAGRGVMLAVGVTFAAFVSMALPFWSTLLFVAASYTLFSVGWAIANPALEALVADLAPADLRGSVIGAKEAAGGVGAALGPLLGGYVYEYWAQEGAFVMNGVILLGAAGLAMVWFRQR